MMKVEMKMKEVGWIKEMRKMHDLKSRVAPSHVYLDPTRVTPAIGLGNAPYRNRFSVYQ